MYILLEWLFFSLTVSQQPGSQKQNAHPSLKVSLDCTVKNGCTEQNAAIVIDSNWMWTHKKGTYTNCYTGNSWDQSLCPDGATCAKNCALDAGPISDYSGTYGVRTSGNELSLQFVTNGPYSTNIGSRTYLLESVYKYRMFKLKNREFTFDVDVSQLPCGLNGALYFVEMQADGGLSEYPNNQAGAAYGTGYCDAQCPHDIKFINGAANVKDWKPSSNDKNSGTGHYGTCCTEMDIWESNSMAQAVTPHSCTIEGQTQCEGISCGDNASGDRYNGVCDKDGCDWNPWRMGNQTFFGKGSNFNVDSSKKMTVVTQFLTTDGTDRGNLSEIRRFYVQDGKKINMPATTIPGFGTFDSITDNFCTAQKIYFNDTNSFKVKGGLASVGRALDRGMVLVMSLWDDHDVDMLWLDSDYPTSAPSSQPGISRGPCSTSSGKPADVENQYPDATVKYSNIKFGEIGSTTPSSVTPAPTKPNDCPGGSMEACMEMCPSEPPSAFKACIEVCVERCSSYEDEAKKF